MTTLKLHKSSVWRLLRLKENEIMLGADGTINYTAKRQGDYVVLSLGEKETTEGE